MKVSVAMTTYNGEKFVSEQLLSLVNQQRQPDEVVICDDGSKDATVSIVQDFIEQHRLNHWRLVCNESNLGYVKNFRKAMSLTSGDIVFLCDQDDIWLPEKIQRAEKIFLQKPQVQALACGYQTIDADGRQIEAPQLIRRGLQKADTDGLSKVDQGVVLYSNIAQGCACAYRREIVTAYCNVEVSGDFPHDWSMNLLAHEKNGLFFLGESLLHYRIHENNTIGISTPQQAVCDRISLLREYASCMAQAQELPQSPQARAYLEKLEKFTQIRIQWLQGKRLNVWLKGFVCYFSVVRHCFFLQYMKDLVLVMMGKVPMGDTVRGEK